MEQRKIGTKEKIYLIAKKLILDQGYKQTTLDQIAAIAKVPKGSVTYYFKKEDFISAIYMEFFCNITARIKKSVGGELDNSFQQHLIRMRIAYAVIFRHEPYEALYREIVFDRLLPNDSVVHGMVRKPLEYLIEEFGIDVSYSEYEYAMEAELGASRRLSIQHFRSESYKPYKPSAEFVNFLSTISARLMNVPSRIIHENVEKAEQLLKKIDYADIPFVDISGYDDLFIGGQLIVK